VWCVVFVFITTRMTRPRRFSQFILDSSGSNHNRVERSHSDDEVLQRARALLAAVEAQTDSTRKLGRLYFVFRELFARPYDETKSPDLLACWNDA
jgi:hypothetical protein